MQQICLNPPVADPWLSPIQCPDPGTYILVLSLSAQRTIAIGALGQFEFPAGYYLYVGSALSGLAGRLRRHGQRDKRPHWHIDYLRRHADLVEIWWAESPERLECTWAGIVCSLPGATEPVPGFGASDCHCPSHLIHFAHSPAFTDFATRVAASHPDLMLHSQNPSSLSSP